MINSFTGMSRPRLLLGCLPAFLLAGLPALAGEPGCPLSLIHI